MMATEAQARLARDLHQDQLTRQGAHSLSVERSPESGKFSVVAWIDQKSKVWASKASLLPETLPIEVNGRTVDVPLTIRNSEPMKLE